MTHPALTRRASAVLLAVAVLAAALLVSPDRAAAAGPHARTAAEKAMITRVLQQINAYRKANHRPALTLNLPLSNSARLHDYRMTQAQTLSHQLPNEAPVWDRATAAGYSWRTVGENIGWTSPRTTARVLQILTLMYEEKPPADGHRKNMLSTSFADIGVDIYGDAAHNRIWMTTDFGHH